VISSDLSPEVLLIGMTVGLSVLALTLLVVTIYAFGEPRRRLKRRIASLGLAPGFVAAGGGGSGSQDLHSRQRRIQEKLRELETAKQKKAQRRNALQSALLRAGLRIKYRTYVFFVIFLGLVVSGTTYAFGFTLLVSGLAGLVGMLGLPRLILSMIARWRQKKFTLEFPNAIDVLVRGVRSGLPISECINIVGREIPDPVGAEFRMLMEGQKLGMTLETIMDRALERMPTTEFRFFAVVLQIQQQTGGNLADTLQNLSNVLRERKKMRDKVKAMSSEAKSSAFIIGSMPVAFFGLVYMIAPEYMSLMLTDRLGHYMIAAGLVSMGIGALVMRAMINFKI